MNHSPEALSRNKNQRIVQDHANKDHHYRRMALEPHRAIQAGQMSDHAIGSLLDPQSLSRPTLLWNRSHGDDSYTN